MANVLVDETSLEAIADTIRSKLGVSDTYLPSEMADAIDDIGGGITPTGTKQISISQNGTTTEDVTAYASAQITVNVPNSYTQSDEGKVVSNGALVSQSSDTVTENDTYDTTLINSLTVNVSGGGVEDYTDFTGGNILAITSHGTEYILTDYSGLLNGIFAIKLADSSVTSWEGYFCITSGSNSLGCQRSGTGTAIALKFISSSSLGFSYDGYSEGDPIVVGMSSIGMQSATATKPLVIFGNYHGGNLEGTKGTFTFYGLNVLNENGQHVKKYRPWLDNGTPCVKELISGTILTNAGTGTFGYTDLNGVEY